MADFFVAFFALPIAIADLAMGAAVFSDEAFLRVATSREAQVAALLIAFLAGVSEMLGQSVILVVNRVPLYRFLASLAFTGATYMVTAVIWGLSALAVAPLTRIGALSLADFTTVTAILALAFAPRLLGVFSLAPYFGGPLSNLLEAWSLALAIFGLHTGLDLPLGAAVFCGMAGWATAYGLRAFTGHMLAGPLSRLRILVSGSTLDKTPREVLDETIARISKKVRS